MSNKEFIEVESGVILHIRDWGKGKPVVFIPGWPLTHEMFEYQFNILPSHGLRCIGVTMRGFGRSSKPWGGYHYDAFADDIDRVLEIFDLHDVTLVGHSMGGAISLHYMARRKSKRVSRLALVGAAAPSFTQKTGFPFGLAPPAVDSLIKTCLDDRAKLNHDFGKIFFRSDDAISMELGRWFFDMGMEASPNATAECLATLRDADLREDLKNINVPTTIFHGIQDKICPFVLAEEMAKGIKGSKLIRFEKSGHGLFYEEKEKFNKALTDFIG